MYYVMQIHGKYKEGKKEEGIKMVVDFYNSINGNVKGFMGFMMTESLDDKQLVANLSFWETKEDMGNYYKNNRDYLSFVDSIEPLIDNIERNEYKIVKSQLNL